MSDRLDTVALGFLLTENRGSLPFAVIHGEALVSVAAHALEAADVEITAEPSRWTAFAAAEEAEETVVVLHDVLCPMTPPEFIARCVEACEESGQVVVGFRPVTDTVKQMEGDRVGRTVHRDELMQITSPVVMPASMAAELDILPLSSLGELVALLSRRHQVMPLEAPADGARVSSVESIRLLEALTLPQGLRTR